MIYRKRVSVNLVYSSNAMG